MARKNLDEGTLEMTKTGKELSVKGLKMAQLAKEKAIQANTNSARAEGEEVKFLKRESEKDVESLVEEMKTQIDKVKKITETTRSDGVWVDYRTRLSEDTKKQIVGKVIKEGFLSEMQKIIEESDSDVNKLEKLLVEYEEALIKIRQKIKNDDLSQKRDAYSSALDLSKKVNSSYLEVKQLQENVTEAKQNVSKIIGNYKTKIDGKKKIFMDKKTALEKKIRKVGASVNQVMDRTDQTEESYGLAEESKDLLISAQGRLENVDGLVMKINSLEIAGTLPLMRLALGVASECLTKTISAEEKTTESFGLIKQGLEQLNKKAEAIQKSIKQKNTFVRKILRVIDNQAAKARHKANQLAVKGFSGFVEGEKLKEIHDEAIGFIEKANSLMDEGELLMSQAEEIFSGKNLLTIVQLKHAFGMIHSAESKSIEA